MNKKLLAVLAATIFSTSASAGCILRTSTLMKVVGKIDDIADIRPLVSQSGKDRRECTVSARVSYKGKWYTIMSDYTGPAEVGDKELCINAVELGVRSFLAGKEDKLFTTEDQMICTDEPEIKVKPVQKGEIIRLSEVLPHPTKGPFEKKGVPCRWFIEPTGQGANYYRWEGIICKTGRKDSDEWTVVDKF